MSFRTGVTYITHTREDGKRLTTSQQVMASVEDLLIGNRPTTSKATLYQRLAEISCERKIRDEQFERWTKKIMRVP